MDEISKPKSMPPRVLISTVHVVAIVIFTRYRPRELYGKLGRTSATLIWSNSDTGNVRYSEDWLTDGSEAANEVDILCLIHLVVSFPSFLPSILEIRLLRLRTNALLGHYWGI